MTDHRFESDRSDDERLSVEASGWISKIDEGFSGDDQDKFLEWLAQDPRHREVYNERLALWNQMNHLEDWRPEHSLEPNPDLLAKRSARPRVVWWQVVGAVAACLIVGVLIAINWPTDNEAESRVLAFGGAESYQNRVLDDGSVVEMNRGAEISVKYSKRNRLILLHKGEAHFMVAKDPGRPFLVRAGGTVLKATGTAFNVAVEPSGVEVMVTEGRVVLNQASKIPSDTDNLDSIGAPFVELVAGQFSRVPISLGSEEFEVSSVSPEEIEQRLQWKSEVLDFTKEPLHKVAQAFNRRNRTKLIIGDQGLHDFEITAKLRSDNLEGFMALLKVTMSVEAERKSEFEIVLHRNDAGAAR